jgi:hypothetical protein
MPFCSTVIDVLRANMLRRYLMKSFARRNRDCSTIKPGLLLFSPGERNYDEDLRKMKERIEELERELQREKRGKRSKLLCADVARRRNLRPLRRRSRTRLLPTTRSPTNASLLPIEMSRRKRSANCAGRSPLTSCSAAIITPCARRAAGPCVAAPSAAAPSC